MLSGNRRSAASSLDRKFRSALVTRTGSQPSTRARLSLRRSASKVSGAECGSRPSASTITRWERQSTSGRRRSSPIRRRTFDSHGGEAAVAEELVEPHLQGRVHAAALGVEPIEEEGEAARALAAGVALLRGAQSLEGQSLLHEALVGDLLQRRGFEDRREVEDRLGGAGERKAVESTDLAGVDRATVKPDPPAGAQVSRVCDVHDPR